MQNGCPSTINMKNLLFNSAHEMVQDGQQKSQLTSMETRSTIFYSSGCPSGTMESMTPLPTLDSTCFILDPHQSKPAPTIVKMKPTARDWSATLLLSISVLIIVVVLATLVLSFQFIGVFYTMLLILVNGLVMTWLELQLTEKCEPVGAEMRYKVLLFVIIAVWAIMTVVMFAWSIANAVQS